jgi:outer membrane protein OmpA-like peptidoglycan-associated protein
MSHSRWMLVLSLLALLVAAPTVYAEGYPFVGVDLGVSEPTNDNYRAHVQTGGTGNPFVGYMFNEYIGAEGQLHFTFQPPDNDQRSKLGLQNIPRENQWTSLFGATAGPRLAVPLGDMLEPYATAQGGIFTGLSGSLTQTAPGFSVGGGLDVKLTPNIAVGLFGRWNRAYTSARPANLVLQDPNESGPSDARWVTAGLSLRYNFIKPPPPPPPPPPIAKAAPPPPPVKKKIVLRSVHFDFDKSNIRRDAVPVLDEAVRIVKEEGIMAVIAEGYTDSKGTEAYNLKLSRRRAEAVRKYLVDHGIPPSHIKIEGFGESNPVASNSTADGRAQNRRVELRVE